MQQAAPSLPFAPCSRSSAAHPPEFLRPTSPSQTRKYCFPAPSCETMPLLGLVHTCCRRSPPHFYASSRQPPQGARQIQPESARPVVAPHPAKNYLPC